MKRELRTILKRVQKGGFHVKMVEKAGSNHLLIEGNCQEVMHDIPDESIDLIITDPPYNLDLDYGKKFNDRKSRGVYFSWLRNRLGNIPRILKKTGSFYLISYPEINARLLPYLEDELGLKLRRWITWHYPTNIGHSKKNFTRSQRSILFLTKTSDYIFNNRAITQLYENPTVSKIEKLIEKGSLGRKAYDFLTKVDLLDMGMTGIKKKAGDVHYIDLLKNVSKDRFTGEHPCQLPFELIKRLVLVSSRRNGLLLDPFSGTFSSSFVASELKRNSVGIEENRDYIRLGLRRFNEK